MINMLVKKVQRMLMSAGWYHENQNPIDNNIPDVLLAEIFKRLPVKDLLRCRCVQKSWYLFVKTPDFINLHFNYHHHPDQDQDHQNDTSKLLLFRTNIYSNELLYLRYDDEQCEQVHNLDLTPLISESEHPAGFLWQATSYSLICVANIYYSRQCRGGNIYIWNPLIKKSKTLPPIDQSLFHHPEWTVLSFGYVPLINDYQVVRIVYESMSSLPGSRFYHLCVYSLNTNSWKTKTVSNDILLLNIDRFQPVSVNGLSCWTAFTTSEYLLLCYDTMSDTLQTTLSPLKADGFLHLVGQSVALTYPDPRQNAFSMYILNRDSVKNNFFWEKKVAVSLPKYIKPTVLGARNNRELILLSKRHQPGLISYDPETNRVKYFVDSLNDWSTAGIDDLFSNLLPFVVHPFVASLVLLDT